MCITVVRWQDHCHGIGACIETTLHRSIFAFSLAFLLLAPGARAEDVAFFFAPYQSESDIPDGFYASGVPTALEDFEDGTLDFGISAPGQPSSVCCPSHVDSVDGDDGNIDGSGLAGEAWFNSDGTQLVDLVFTFQSPLPTAAGLVWTDGGDDHDTRFEAFGPGMVSLGVVGPIRIADTTIVGTTAEDRFFGVQSLSGILAIKIENLNGVTVTGIEVDHVQYGDAVTGGGPPPGGSLPQTFFGPAPYLSAADIPDGFYAADVPTALEDFEDGSLDFGISGEGQPGSICCPTAVDSVDSDDGAIDGSGSAGESWFNDDGAEQIDILFTFSQPLPTAAGLVWTDGGPDQDTVFEAFGPGMVSLGIVGPTRIADGTFLGTTAEDRFFGVHNPDGVLAIRVENFDGPTVTGIEVDHVQFGEAPAIQSPPALSTTWLVIALLALGVALISNSTESY